MWESQIPPNPPFSILQRQIPCWDGGPASPPAPGCCCFLYLFKIPAPGAWPAPAAPMVFAQAHWGPARDCGAMGKLLCEPDSNLFFFPKLHQRAAFCLLFFLLLSLLFLALPPHLSLALFCFPSAFSCFSFPLLFHYFWFILNVEVCKQPGLLSQLGIRGEKRPFWVLFGVWGDFAAKGRRHLGK